MSGYHHNFEGTLLFTVVILVAFIMDCNYIWINHRHGWMPPMILYKWKWYYICRHSFQFRGISKITWLSGHTVRTILFAICWLKMQDDCHVVLVTCVLYNLNRKVSANNENMEIARCWKPFGRDLCTRSPQHNDFGASSVVWIGKLVGILLLKQKVTTSVASKLINTRISENRNAQKNNFSW